MPLKISNKLKSYNKKFDIGFLSSKDIDTWFRKCVEMS